MLYLFYPYHIYNDYTMSLALVSVLGYSALGSAGNARGDSVIADIALAGIRFKFQNDGLWGR